MSNLLHQKCQASAAPMSDATVHDHLAQVSGWQLKDGSIEKTYAFKNYYETIAFVNALAWICNTEDHHPDLAVSYSRCVVRFNTHSVGGISINDFICAAKTDALVAFIA
ncbi:MAG: 4a-hydroxytetrahydrobiopterin dehydratase [Burkholderiaceae bacterium]